MLEVGSLQQARATRMPRALRTGDAAWVGIVIGPAFGTEPPQRPAPQCFLVEQSPGSTVLPHFHPCDQFQLVVGGSGRIGAHAVQPYSVHYARHDTGYGPVVAGPEGLSYLSIRADASWITHYLPEARERMGPGPRLNLFASATTPLEAAALRGLPRREDQTLLSDAEHGSVAWTSACPPGTPLEIDAAGRTAFGLVLAGEVRASDRVLGVGSCLCVHAGAAPRSLDAGPDGTQVLWMRFPPE